MGISLGIMGATGAVGEVMRQIVDERNLPYDTITFLASERSAGTTLKFRNENHVVKAIGPDAFKGLDIILSSTPSSISREFSPIAAKAGAVVVDNSSAFRMDPEVPLVVPEVNPEAIAKHKGIIANPNCSTIQMVVALKPLHDLGGLKRVVVSTYQASSGKGGKGLEDFERQLAHACHPDGVPEPTAHKHQLLDNCLPDDWTIGDEGYSEEEWKMVNETRKILGEESLGVTVTCVRVPVRCGHSESINLEFERPVSPEAAREALAAAPGVIVLDDPVAGNVPLAKASVGRDEVFVGRIRRDPTVPYGLNLWVVADNLRKGAATNAVQIAEHLLKLSPASA
ncbi:Aspartate-semialdehyde dehydrogenase [Planctomycetes bacterium Pan216]|uniref:Aspartate-semialdehyde dehydrogenase n=1 Tax=Kolteria novifilia TaxID=2527975 RepID=A0A518BBZ8_9BACT|nr:Aspartate-semialdehyde dehydrogenase [Planctomycetes bacterium Pan216]